MYRVPYASAVGILMYVMVCTRPNHSHAVRVLRMYMSKPRKEHWTTVKRIFRYFRRTTSYGLCYQGRPGLERVLYMALWVQTGLEIWIVGDLQVGMCLTCLEEQLVG